METEQELHRRIIRCAKHGDAQHLHELCTFLSPQLDLRIGHFLSHPDESGWTALHFAAQGGTKEHLQVMKKLLEYTVNVNAQDRKSCTPLHVAAQFSCCAGIQALISALADRNMLDDRNRLPRDCANGAELRRLLEEPREELERGINVIRKEVPSLDDAIVIFETSDLRRLEGIVRELEMRIEDTRRDLILLLRRTKELRRQPVDPDTGSSILSHQCQEYIRAKSQAVAAEACVRQGYVVAFQMRRHLANNYLVVAANAVEKEICEGCMHGAENLEGLFTEEGALAYEVDALSVGRDVASRRTLYRHCQDQVDSMVERGQKGKNDEPPPRTNSKDEPWPKPPPGDHWAEPEFYAIIKVIKKDLRTLIVDKDLEPHEMLEHEGHISLKRLELAGLCDIHLGGAALQHTQRGCAMRQCVGPPQCSVQ